jgi:hypothetical protein
MCKCENNPSGVDGGTPDTVAEIKRRFTLCKACEHSRDDGFACAQLRGCCFGRRRSNPANRCRATLAKW